jgi:hypothetical protein
LRTGGALRLEDAFWCAERTLHTGLFALYGALCAPVRFCGLKTYSGARSAPYWLLRGD